MKKLTAATLNMVLALGVICILTGILFFVRVSSKLNAQIETWTVFVTVIGAFVFYLSLIKFNYALVFFSGLFSVLAGFFFMILSSGVIGAGVSSLWPFVIVLAGISLMFTGIAKDRRIRVSYFFPSMMLVFLGLFFMLFSLDIIDMSFRKWISIFWPLFPFLLGLSLVVLFLIQQNPASHFPYDTSESEDERVTRE
ncbi:hypothetical protein [Treponema pectinovorum]|uniref:hypothetical protein n=1 Tax=Treponema pectinovorum TaxID=164 RepID=UPI0011C8F80F|nr:hypothetical protein [Treponema pectinovorum]